MLTIINTQKEKIKRLPKSIKNQVNTSWILFIIFLVITIIYFFLSQPELPIFYTLANKQSQLAPKVFLFLFPTISLTINIIHFFILKSLQKFSATLLKLFIGTTVGLQILLGFALIRIIIITI